MTMTEPLTDQFKQMAADYPMLGQFAGLANDYLEAGASTEAVIVSLSCVITALAARQDLEADIWSDWTLEAEA